MLPTPKPAFLAALFPLLLAGCQFQPLGEAYSESEAMPYRVLARDDGAKQLELRIPVPYDWGDGSDDVHRLDSAPAGQPTGTWWKQTILHPTSDWTDADEFWLGWWLLDAFQIDRQYQTSPLGLEKYGPASLYARFAADTIHAYNSNFVFTEYIPPSETSGWTSSLSGSAQDTMFGIFFRALPSDTPVVAQAVPGSAAARAGLTNGDRILSVDGRTGASIVPYIQDSVGNRTATFVVLHSGSTDATTLRIARAPANPPSAYADTLPGGVGYVRLTIFDGGDATNGIPSSYEDFDTAVQWMAGRSSGPWILDLRSNGGGYIEIARRIVSSLVPTGSQLIRQRARDIPAQGNLDGAVSTTILTDSTTLPRHVLGRKILVLQDSGSASATELTISALRNCLGSKVKTYGTKTFGKGIGQSTFGSPLGAIYKVTSLHLDPISEPSYHRIGIAADIPVSLDSVVVRAWNDAKTAATARSIGGTRASLDPNLLRALEWNRRESARRPPPELPVRPLRNLLRTP
jgi:C-terminal processing protease CtpA/Prc